MKQLTCEMCSSTDLIKQEGVFVCQSCGTKYSVEEAKRMMIEGTVEVTGVVKVDTSHRLDNLYQLARRATEGNNLEDALKYYEMILLEDVNSWEAVFHTTINKINYDQMIDSVPNSIESLFRFITDSISDEDERQKAVTEVATYYMQILDSTFERLVTEHLQVVASYKWGDDIAAHNDEVKRTKSYLSTQCTLLINLGDHIAAYFGSQKYAVNLAIRAWKKAGKKITEQKIKEIDREQIISRIKEYDPSYQPSKKTGCYIATAVYGSYDSPQVLVLRHYRDTTLSKNWYGRTFIAAYYAVSPALVKWIGNSKWIKSWLRLRLDTLIEKLSY